jgi:hypothetical protein
MKLHKFCIFAENKVMMDNLRFPIIAVLVVLISSLSSCKPPYDEYHDYLDGAWVVEDYILHDPTGILSGEDALQMDQKKALFYFDYSGNVRTPMGKRKFRFKEDHKILVIGEYKYLFEKIDDERFKLHHVRDNGAAEIIYILKKISDEEYKEMK